jgi:hypothetical protein
VSPDRREIEAEKAAAHLEIQESDQMLIELELKLMEAAEGDDD